MRVLLVDRATGPVELITLYDSELVGALKAHIPPRARSWEPSTKSWTISRQYAENIEGLLADLCHRVEWLTSRDAANRHQATQTCDPDYRALHVQPDAPREVVTAAHRALALLHHPDRAGYGSTAQMQRINAAYDRVKAKRGWAS